MNSIAEKSKTACSGCGACMALCPKEAICLRLNEAGFYEAQVDESKCIRCGLCKTACARFTEPVGKPLQEGKLLALQSVDAETVKHCSSGGIAHELARLAIADGSSAVGVIYNTETDRAEHRIIETAKELPLLDGSKYIQSNTSIFPEVLRQAKAGKCFAVFGTPCQIMGLDRAARKIGVRDRLLLAEIFCHGVPSYALWDAQCEKMKKKLNCAKFDEVQFRYKKDDWHSYCLKASAGGKSFFGKRETELFWQVFFENILLGDACMECEARKDRSCADLRLGDYWGSRYASRSDGVSAVFAMTPRGEQALSRLSVTVLEPGTAAEMLRAQNMAGYSQLRLHADAMNTLRATGDIRKAVKHYRAGQTPKQKIKRFVLRASAIVPDGLRARLRKAHSTGQLKT